MNNIDVCALIVTYNRSEYLRELLIAILDQSVSVKRIVVFDNYSNDDTQNLLAEMHFIDNPLSEGSLSVKVVQNVEVHCMRNTTNSGGSGGFHDGIKYARSLESQYIWIMDDDVLPEKDCLEKLLAQMAPFRRICIPNRTGDGYIDNAITHVDMSNPLLFSIALRKTYISANKITEDVISVEDMPFEGPLIDSTLIDEIGFPNKDLFIVFDDSEFCTRALRVTSVGFVKSAHLYKQIIPNADHSRLMGWKDYYGYRNQYWFDRTYGKNAAVRVLRPLFSRINLTLRAIVRRKWQNIKIISRAYDDGVHMRLGKLVEPGEIM